MRNFLVTLSIVLGSVLVLVLAVGVYLMISPGAEVFGIKYITAQKQEKTEFNYQIDEMVTGDIYVYTDEVPVIIDYQPYTSFKIAFTQKFTGFTKTKIDNPSISIKEDENGNLVIVTSEFKKFVWGTSRTGYELKITLPSNYKNRGIKVESVKSDVSIGGTNAQGKVSEFSVKTAGQVSFFGAIEITSNLEIKKTTAAVTIGEGVNIQGDANIKVGGTSCTIVHEIGGKLTFVSSGGNLTFTTAYELDAKTKGGRVTSTSSNVSVYSHAKINTSSGDIKLQFVGGDLAVQTRSGSVSIGTKEGLYRGTAGTVNISTKQGEIVLKGTYSATTLAKLSTSSGNITVEKLKIVNITSSRGSIKVDEIEKITIKTGSSTIKIGKVKLEANIISKSGKITLVGEGSDTKVEIKGGTSDINASRLGNETTIKTEGKIKAVFVACQGKIDITGKDKAVTVIIPDAVTVPPYYYRVKSTKKSATILITGVEDDGKNLSNYTSLPTGADIMLISISSRYGKIKLLNETNTKA